VRRILTLIVALHVERHGHPIGQTNTPKPDYQCPRRQCEVMGDGFVGCHYALVKQAGGRMSAQRLHVLDETGQLGEFLRDLRLGNESALAPPDLDEAALDQILDRLPHSRAADFELLDQAFFRWQLSFWRQAAVSDAGGQNGLNAFVQGRWGHNDIVTSLRLAVKARLS